MTEETTSTNTEIGDEEYKDSDLFEIPLKSLDVALLMLLRDMPFLKLQNPRIVALGEIHHFSMLQVHRAHRILMH